MDNTVNRAISIAQLRYGGDDKIFCTANFQLAMKDLTGKDMGDITASQILLRHPHIERLHGGSHWRYTNPPTP